MNQKIIKALTIGECIHFKKEKVDDITGFSMAFGKKGGQIQVSTKGFVDSDNINFYSFAEQTSKIFLYPKYDANHISQFLVILHKDNSADVYINNLPILLTVFGKKEISPGEPVSIDDIFDITELDFDQIQIQSDDRLVLCFKTRWKFGFYYNFQRDTSNYQYELGHSYKSLLYKDNFTIIEHDPLYNQMREDGWFPFIQILGEKFTELREIYEKSGDVEYFTNDFIESFSQESIMEFVNEWWKNPLFEEKKKILMAGIESYLQKTEEGYISCIKNLYSEIEGIIRITLFRETGKKKITFKDLKEFVKDKASSTFISPTTLTFPNEFYNYLDQELFANFDMSVGNVDLSKHTSSHGVANPDEFTQVRAFQSILILDQIYFYLT